jgi:hypothetical protein
MPDDNDIYATFRQTGNLEVIDASAERGLQFTATGIMYQSGGIGPNVPSYIVGSGVPSSTLGNNGDVYVDSATGNLYMKVTGAWNGPLTNLKGSPGTPGATGPVGPAGPSGGAGGQTFSTFTSIAASSLTLSVGQTFYVKGYATEGDGGGHWRIVIASPVTPTAYSSRYAGVSVNGVAHTYLQGQRCEIEQFGGVGDGVYTNASTFSGTDNYPAVMAQQECTNRAPVTTNIPSSAPIYWGAKYYYFSQGFDLRTTVYWHGVGAGAYTYNNGTVLLFPAGVVAITVNDNFSGGGTKLTTALPASVNSYFSGLHIISAGNGGVTLAPDANHGIWLRTRGFIEDCVIDGFTGNGINIVGSTSAGTGALYGSPNGWWIKRTQVRNIAGHGLYIQGADSNAGTSHGFEAFGVIGLSGIYDASSFGNEHYGYDIGGADRTFQGIADILNDHRYYLINTTPGIGSSTQPGTDETIWRRTGIVIGASSSIAWNSANTYQVAVGYYCQGASLFGGGYTEGLIGVLGNLGISLGGTSGPDPDSSYLTKSVGNYGNSSMWNAGVGGVSIYTGAGNAQVGTSFYTYSGSKLVTGNILGWAPSIDATRWNFQYINGDTILQRASSVPQFRATGGKVNTIAPTLQHAGRASFYELGFLTPRIAIGDGTEAGARVIQYATVPPTTGTYAQGEVRLKQNAGPGQPFGWSCVTAGSTSVTAWAAGTAFIDDLVTNGGVTYLCTVQGTKFGSGPSGTGTVSEGQTATRGQWTTATAYTAGDTVYTISGVYSAGSTAPSGATTPSGTTTSSDGTITWTYIGPLAASRGTFVSGTSYTAGDTVYCGAHVYIAGNTAIGTVPPSGTTTAVFRDQTQAWTFIGPAGAVWTSQATAFQFNTFGHVTNDFSDSGYPGETLAAGVAGATRTITATNVALADFLIGYSFNGNEGGAGLVRWISAVNTIKYYFFNSTAASITVPAGIVIIATRKA